MNKLLPIGCTLSAALTALAYVDPELAPFAWIIAILFGLQITGVALIVVGARRIGAWVVLAGALPMIPAGLVCALGARRTLDELAAERFERGCSPH